MDQREMFLGTLGDLRARINHVRTEYDLTQAAGLIRRLLLDRGNLVALVNRVDGDSPGRRVQVAFEVGDLAPMRSAILSLDPVLWTAADAIDPVTSPTGASHRVGLDAFLRERVLHWEGQTYSVRDVIQFLAIVQGGVHAGRPRDDKEVALDRLVSDIQVGGQGSVIYLMRAIGRVVMRALEPLRQSVSMELHGHPDVLGTDDHAGDFTVVAPVQVADAWRVVSVAWNPYAVPAVRPDVRLDASADGVGPVAVYGRRLADEELATLAEAARADADDLRMSDPDRDALTRILEEYAPPGVPVIVSKVVEDIDALVRPIRGTRWQERQPGDREVRRQLRLILGNAGLPASGDLYDRACAYIREHY